MAEQLPNPKSSEPVLAEDDFPPYEDWMSDFYVAVTRDKDGTPQLLGIDYVAKFGASPPRWGCNMVGTKNLAWSILNQWFSEGAANENYSNLASWMAGWTYQGERLFYSDVANLVMSGNLAKVVDDLSDTLVGCRASSYAQVKQLIFIIFLGLVLAGTTTFLSAKVKGYFGFQNTSSSRVEFYISLIILYIVYKKCMAFYHKDKKELDDLSDAIASLDPGMSALEPVHKEILKERGFDPHFWREFDSSVGFFVMNMENLKLDTIRSLPYYEELILTPTFSMNYRGFSLRMALERTQRYHTQRKSPYSNSPAASNAVVI